MKHRIFKKSEIIFYNAFYNNSECKGLPSAIVIQHKKKKNMEDKVECKYCHKKFNKNYYIRHIRHYCKG